MAYTIEAGRIVFDEAPADGAEVEIIVSKSNNLNGFSDPNSFYPRRVNEPDTNRLAANDLRNQHPVVQRKRESVDDLTGEPKTAFGAQYPFNHVKETESGHIVEFDDTPGRERIHEYHRAGTFYEIHPDGSKVTKVVGEDYEIVHKDKKLRVRGNIEVYVDGDASLYVRGDMDAQVDENFKLNVGKNIDIHAGQNIRMFANQAMEMTSKTTMSQTSVGNMLMQADGKMQIITASDFTNSVLGNYDMVVDGNYVKQVDGTYATQITGNSSFITEGTYTAASTGAMQLDANATLKVGASGAIDIDGSTVDLNSNGRSAVTIAPIVPRVSPSPAVVGIAPAMTYVDSGTLDTGIKAWTNESTLLDTDGYPASLTAPKSAEVLAPKPFVVLKDDDSSHANDDEELSLDDVRAAVTRGDIRPSSMSDYSFNALEGSYTLQNITRSVTARPIIPVDNAGDHTTSDNPYISEPEATNTSVSPNPTDASNYDAEGKFIGGINYRLQISPNFKLRDISSSAVVTKNRIVHNQHGNTEQVIIDNLSVLANNVLEPIKTKYPNMFVTSGFRIGSGTSQHERGLAADMQFTGVAKSDYINIATWIRENVPHDQLILEFKNTGTGLPWIHISCKDAGNRNQIFTMWNHSRYGDIGKFYQLA